MALMASCNERIDLKKSVMIGDKESDLLYLPGLTHFLIKGDYPLDEKKYKNITYENIQNLFETLQKGHYFWR